jgi:hypothetical protein
MFMYLRVPHAVAETCLSLAATSIKSELPSGNAPTNYQARRRASLSSFRWGRVVPLSLLRRATPTTFDNAAYVDMCEFQARWLGHVCLCCLAQALCQHAAGDFASWPTKVYKACEPSLGRRCGTGRII